MTTQDIVLMSVVVWMAGVATGYLTKSDDHPFWALLVGLVATMVLAAVLVVILMDGAP